LLLGRSDERSLVQPVISAVHRVCAALLPSGFDIVLPPRAWAAAARGGRWRSHTRARRDDRASQPTARAADEHVAGEPGVVAARTEATGGVPGLRPVGVPDPGDAPPASRRRWRVSLPRVGSAVLGRRVAGAVAPEAGGVGDSHRAGAPGPVGGPPALGSRQVTVELRPLLGQPECLHHSRRKVAR
jgi:hypothetical protein